MTAKEKAKELVDSFFLTIVRYDDEHEIKISHELAKDCALIAVDEILKTNEYFDSFSLIDDEHEPFEWWQEVKEEIKKL